MLDTGDNPKIAPRNWLRSVLHAHTTCCVVVGGGTAELAPELAEETCGSAEVVKCKGVGKND